MLRDRRRTPHDRDDVVVELLFHVNAKGLGKGTMHYGPQSVGPVDGAWFDYQRGWLSGSDTLFGELRDTMGRLFGES